MFDTISLWARGPARRRRSVFMALAGLLVLGVAPARAQVGSDRYSSIVIDSATGSIISAANPDELRFPASLTKMMTLYLLFEAVRDHRVALNDYVPISPNAASMPPTKLGLVPGNLITVEQAILGLVTKSANDAASALGEMLGGDEDRFAQMMTLRAHALGMSRTTFRNASGLPDWNQFTTARDMALLARHLIQDFPGFYHYFSTPSFIYAGHIVRSHQHLIVSYPGADGLKTGYTDASGYNVVTSAVRADTRLIGVVLGANSGGERDAHMTVLLDQGFDRMGVAPLVVARRDPAYRNAGLARAPYAAPPAPPAMVQAVIPARNIPPRQPYGRAVAIRRLPDQRSERPVTLARNQASIRQATVTTPIQVIRPGTPATTRTAHGLAYVRYPG